MTYPVRNLKKIKRLFLLQFQKRRLEHMQKNIIEKLTEIVANELKAPKK